MRNPVFRALALAVVLSFAVVPLAHADGRITGGTKVTRAAYDARWGSIVSLRPGLNGETLFQSVVGGSREQHECAGTLVAPRVVVTAAHCVTSDDPESARVLGERLRVLGGTRVLTNGPVQPGRLVDVQAVRVHPSWRGGVDEFRVQGDTVEFDVAVLFLAAPLDGVPVTPLVAADERELWGAGAGLRVGARVAGWGVTNSLYSDVDDDVADNTQAELREVALPILADRSCENTDGAMGADAAGFDRTSMLCAYRPNTLRRGVQSNRGGACYGDSGGPLTVPGGDGRPRLVGIVSWGPEGAGGCNRPSVFTRVDGMRDWITQTISEEAAPSVTAAPSQVAGSTRSVNSVRVTWDAGAGPAVRYRLLREMRLPEYLGAPVGSDDVEEEDLPAARVAFLNRLHVLVPMGSTGPDGRGLLVRDLRPSRPASQRRLGFRVEVTDAQGRQVTGPLRAVAAPVDGHPPVRPAAPRLAKRGARVPTLAWRLVRDEDCVATYLLQLRRAGTAAWTTKLVVDGPACSDGDGTSLLDREDDSEDEGDDDSTPPRATLYATARGTYAARVVAIDRAGNRATGPSAVVRVPANVPFPDDEE
ncbi:MAG: serine protease [Thermoleophilia bacterium]|nr:serine protease [Thermoleophilia bacterium]